MTTEVAPQNMYRDVNIKVPRYRYARVVLNNLTSGTVALAPTASTLLEWKIAANTVVNLSKSFIAYQWTLPALANNWGFTFEDGCDFRWAYLGSGSGLGIVDLQYCDASVNALRPVETKLEQFLQKDQLSQFYKCNQLANTNLLPFSRDGLTVGTDNASTDNYLEPQHLWIASTVNTAVNVYRYFPLSSFKRTFFNVNKDVVFGTDMFIRLNTQYLTRMCGYTTSPQTPSQNYTAITSTTVTMTNVYLYLAIEENLDIRASLLGHLSKGSIRMSIPYLYNYRFSTSGNSASANVSLTLTKNYGRIVKSITVVPYNAQELTQYAYDHSNVNGTKLPQIQTTIDGRPLVDYLLNCYNGYSSINPNTSVASGFWSSPASFADDYREMLKYTQGSAITSYPAFQTMWLYTDSFGVFNKQDGCDIPDDNVNDGLDLLHSGDHVYSLQAICTPIQNTNSSCYTSGLINYVMVEFRRSLVIAPDGITFEP